MYLLLCLISQRNFRHTRNGDQIQLPTFLRWASDTCNGLLRRCYHHKRVLRGRPGLSAHPTWNPWTLSKDTYPLSYLHLYIRTEWSECWHIVINILLYEQNYIFKDIFYCCSVKKIPSEHGSIELWVGVGLALWRLAICTLQTLPFILKDTAGLVYI